MSDAVVGSIIMGGIGLIGSLIAYVGGQTRGRAEAGKLRAEADVTRSADYRQWTAVFAAETERIRAAMVAEQDARLLLQSELAATRGELADVHDRFEREHERCAALERRVADLERIIAAAGLDLPQGGA